MTVSKIYPKSGPFEGGGLVYPFYFEVGSVDEIVVYEGNEVSNNVQSVLIHEDGIGGEITLKTISDKRVTIVRKSDFSQEIDFQNNTTFLPEVIEQGLDHAVKLAQELKVGLDSAIKIPLDSEKKPEDLMEDLLSSVDSAKAAAAEAVQAVKEAGDVVDEAKETVKIIEDKATEVSDSVSAVTQKAEEFSQSVENAKSDISTLRDEAVAHIEETLGQLGAELDVSIGELV